MKLRTSAVACLTTAAVLVVPGLAQAKTKSVSMGPTKAASKQIQKNGPLDVNDFFPRGVTVRVGDKVKFTPNGFHNLDLPAKGDDPAALLGPTGANATGVNDAAGSPFWFNDKVPIINFNPELVTTQGFGKKFSYNGSKGVQSGLPLASTKPVTVTFKKKGAYTYYCDVHPGMKGKVTVKGKKAKVPSAKADKKRLKKQIASAVKTSKSLLKVEQPANTVDIGVAGKHGAELFAFAPQSLTVPVGTTVKFRMSAGSYEVHTATAGPGDPGDPKVDSYLKDIAKSFEGSPTGIDPRGVYRSEAPGTIASLTPTLHGNGYWNSGVLDASSATPQLAGDDSVTFSQAGTYTFYCLVHPFMKGTVTAQ